MGSGVMTTWHILQIEYIQHAGMVAVQSDVFVGRRSGVDCRLVADITRQGRNSQQRMSFFLLAMSPYPRNEHGMLRLRCSVSGNADLPSPPVRSVEQRATKR